MVCDHTLLDICIMSDCYCFIDFVKELPENVPFLRYNIISNVISHRAYNALSFLMKKYGPDLKDENGCSFIHYAVLNQNIVLTTYLINQGSDVNLKSIYGHTPLHFAAIPSIIQSSEVSDNLVDIIYILMHFNADKNIKDGRGFVPGDYLKYDDKRYEIFNTKFILT